MLQSVQERRSLPYFYMNVLVPLHVSALRVGWKLLTVPYLNPDHQPAAFLVFGLPTSSIKAAPSYYPGLDVLNKQNRFRFHLVCSPFAIFRPSD